MITQVPKFSWLGRERILNFFESCYESHPRHDFLDRIFSRKELMRDLALVVSLFVASNRCSAEAEDVSSFKDFRLGAHYAYTSQSIHRDDHGSRFDFASRWKSGSGAALYYENEWRSYEAGATLHDHRWGVEPVIMLQKRLYLEGVGAFTLQPDFWSRYLVGLSPHFLFSDHWDWGIGFRFQDYKTVSTWLIVSTVNYEDFWGRVQLRMDALVKPVSAVSGALSVMIPYRVFEFEMRGGGGEADEGDGLMDRFKRGGGALRWAVTSTFSCLLESDYYFGRRREEVKWATGLQWTL